MRRLVDIMGSRQSDSKRPSVPATVAVFAIGDIQGQQDHLVRMHQQILQHAQSLPANIRKTIVYMGDYVGAGAYSADVIDLLVSAPLCGFKSIFLMGDQDRAFLRYLKGEMGYMERIDWLNNQNGAQILKSYDVCAETNPSQTRAQILRKIPTDHLTFLEQLHVNHTVGDFFFVHAGINPQRALNNQMPHDMLSIGNEFLSSTQIYDKIIVHGHTPFSTATLHNNRIALNTYVAKSGLLSGLMITRDQVTLLQSKSDA